MTDTSDILNASRGVLYGDNENNEPVQPVTLENMYQLLVGINGRLAKIEEKITSIDKLNANIANITSEFKTLKTKVGSIDGNVNKLEEKVKSVASEVSSVKTKHCSIERELDEIRKRSREREADLQGLSNIMDENKRKHENNTKDINAMRTSISKVANDLEDQSIEQKEEIKCAISDIKAENEDLRNELLDLKCRSMKNNLIFNGLREPINENTERLLRQFISTELNIKNRIEFGNVHRFGHGAKPGKRGRPRPIIARFIYQNDLKYVLSNAYRLKGKGYSIKQQFPDVIEQARKSLIPIMLQKRAEGYRVKLERDILLVDGIPYQEDDDLYNDEEDRRTEARAGASNYSTPNRHQNFGNKRRRSNMSTPS